MEEGLAGARLGFIRLKCLSVNRTLKFYTTVLHFSLKRKAELNKGAFSYLFLIPRGDGPELEARLAVELRFECERFKQLKYSKMSKVPVCAGSKIRLVFYVKSMRDVILAVERSVTGAWVFCMPERHGMVVIAIVVDPNGILIQLVELTAESLLKIPANYTVHSNANLLMGDEGGAPGAKGGGTYTEKLSFQFAPVRFGYVIIKSNNAVEQATFYETLFAPGRSDQLDDAGDLINDGASISSKLTGVSGDKQQGNASVSRKQQQESTGIYIVDKEDFPDMLSTYVWLGSGPRSQCTSLCFMHKIERQNANITRFRHGQATAAKSKSACKSKSKKGPERSDNETKDPQSIEEEGREEEDEEDEDAWRESATQFMMHHKTLQESDPFLGIGITVYDDMQLTMNRLRRNVRYPVTFSRKLQHMKAVGQVCGFVDPNFIQVHLLNANSPHTSETGKSGKDKKKTAKMSAGTGKAQRSHEMAMAHQVEIPAQGKPREDPKLSLARFRELEEKRRSQQDVEVTAELVPGKVFPGRMDRLKN